MGMAKKLIARLFDGSEHEVTLSASDAEDVLKRLTDPARAKWIDVEDGSVRYDSIVALQIVEEDADRDINELLLELHARGGGTLEEVTRELERRGIEVSQESRGASS